MSNLSGSRGAAQHDLSFLIAPPGRVVPERPGQRDLILAGSPPTAGCAPAGVTTHTSPTADDDSARVADWAAVEALLSGRLRARAVHPVDRRDAVAVLTRRGCSAAEIAARIGTSGRTVARIRAVLRAQVAA